jgi:predicted AlkP superfamily pyrophosphatase or phosphodiesterase
MVVHLIVFLCATAGTGCGDAAATLVSPADGGASGVSAPAPYRLPEYAVAASERPGVATGQGRAATSAPTIVHHVIIISEDGLRPDALLLAHGPVHAAIMREGAYSMTARTIRHASTLPAHAAMLSGFDEGAHGLSWNGWKPERGFIQVPTVFDAALHAGDGSAAFVGKRKLEHIAPPGSIDVFSRPGFFCKKVVEEAARYFVEKRPQIEFVHFSDPDERGHAVGWMSDSQIEAIRHTDACLATLIRAVHLAGMADDTLFILSADHGGHGRNHSGRTEEDRLIPWIAWGAGVRPGVHLTGPISTMDTAATALWALGYPAPPEMQGRPVIAAFTN